MKKIFEYFKKVKSYAFLHKKLSIIILIIILGLGYWTYNKITSTTGEIQYVTAKVQRGAIISSITGSGQVSSLNEVSLNTKASGELVYLNAKVGQEVKNGALIARLDSGDASFQLESAKISYNDLITVDKNTLRKAELTTTKAEEAVTNAYATSRSTLISRFSDMSDAIGNINDLLDGYLNSSKFGISKQEKLFIQKVEESYNLSYKALVLFKKDYTNMPSETDREKIKLMLDNSYAVANKIAQTTKYAQDAVIYLRDREEDNKKTEADTAFTTVNNIVSSINTAVSSLSSIKENIITTERDLETAKIDLEDTKDGPTISEIRSSELSVRQKQETLSNYSVFAPFDGIIAAVDVEKGATLNSGITVAKLITKEKIAEISLNEVDVAKIKVGQKTTLTFDAIENLSITGTVAEIDMVGTVSSGVVSYNIKITFGTEDDRIKPGMSVSASITTDSRSDVLIVPSSAVKTSANIKYVQMFTQPLTTPVKGSQGTPSTILPKQVKVEIGLTDDTNTEIISGLKEGDQVVSRTITNTTTTASTSSLLGGSNTRGMGGALH